MGPVTIRIAHKMTGAVAVTNTGALQSIETSGLVKARGVVYCETDLHMMLLSLDQKDLRDSESLCLLPMGEGNIRIRSSVPSRRLEVQVGEFTNARWTPFESGKVQAQNGWLRWDVTQDRNLSVVVLAGVGKMNSAVNRLTNLLEVSFPS